MTTRDYILAGNYQALDALIAERDALAAREKMTLPMIRSAIMLLVELRQLYVPPEGHFRAQIDARIASLQKRLAQFPA